MADVPVATPEPDEDHLTQTDEAAVVGCETGAAQLVLPLPGAPAAESVLAEELPAGGTPPSSTAADPEILAIMADLEATTAGGTGGQLELAFQRPREARVALIGFGVYAGLWASLAVACVALLWGAARQGDLVGESLYAATLLGGVVLAAAGPALTLTLWLKARHGVDSVERHGLLSRFLLRGALATLGGVAAWTMSLLLLDMVRVGWIG
jgi:hypothetical protein